MLFIENNLCDLSLKSSINTYFIDKKVFRVLYLLNGIVLEINFNGLINNFSGIYILS
jgi:hypothetical protein